MTVQFKTGVAIAALLMAPFAAHAADLVRPFKAPPMAVPAYANWSGAYVGVNVGYGFGKSDWAFPAVSPSPKGALAGVTLGYNYQTGVWVWGLEGDWDWSGVKGDADCTAFGLGTCTTKNDWLATARARLGYAGWNNWLPYITGGVAFGDIKASTALGDASKTKVGWAAGAGIEYAMMANWSLKAEYLYADLGTFDCGITCGLPSDNVSFKANLIRGGLNYRF
jgi:outer membrane immunogenic protein